jgi:hypothetical protein
MDATLGKMKPNVDIVKPDDVVDVLKPGELGAILELVVWDPKTGEVIEKRTLKSKSFVRQMLELLAVRFMCSPALAPVNIRDTGNIVRAIYDSAYSFDTTAAATVVTHGIIIGTDGTPPTINDYKIGVIIPHATMNYSAMTYGAPAADATTSQMTCTRNFANVSGGPVTVNEIALYCRAYYASAIAYLMLIRDIVAGGIIVPNGQTLTINYRPQAVV